MPKKSDSIKKALLFIICLPFLVLLVVGVLILLPLYCLYRVLLRIFVEVLLIIQGKRVLLVYSRSPTWEKYVEENWIPHIGDHAMVLNWSDRAKWYRWGSLPVWIFRFWAPLRNFNPMVIVFPWFSPAKEIGFFYAFRDWKHGNSEKLQEAENRLFDALELVNNR